MHSKVPQFTSGDTLRVLSAYDLMGSEEGDKIIGRKDGRKEGRTDKWKREREEGRWNR